MEIRHNEVTLSGAIVYWSAGPTSLELISARLRNMGLGDFAPAPRSDNSALRAALLDCFDDGKSKVRIEPHKKQKQNGVEVVEIERGETDNDYRSRASAKLDEGGRVRVRRGNVHEMSLQNAFESAKCILPGASVSQSLVSILSFLGGTALRPSGAVYWIPDSAVETWCKVAAAVEESIVGKEHESKVYMIRSVMDRHAVRAVRDAIVNEVTMAASLLAEQVCSGDLGEVALNNRKAAAMQLHTRVEQYESLLGEGMERLHAVISMVEQSATLAALQGM